MGPAQLEPTPRTSCYHRPTINPSASDLRVGAIEQLLDGPSTFISRRPFPRLLHPSLCLYRGASPEAGAHLLSPTPVAVLNTS